MTSMMHARVKSWNIPNMRIKTLNPVSASRMSTIVENTNIAANSNMNMFSSTPDISVDVHEAVDCPDSIVSNCDQTIELKVP